jgi:hypothetical protein
MLFKLIDLILLAVFGIVYLYSFIQVVKMRFKGGEPHTPAFITVSTAALIAASINLYGIADITSDALNFFLNQRAYVMALLYSGAFFIGMWIFSLILFHIGFLIISTLTQADEMEALEANDMELALVHAVIMVTLAFVISPALVNIAGEFIPYPKVPF